MVINQVDVRPIIIAISDFLELLPESAQRAELFSLISEVEDDLDGDQLREILAAFAQLKTTLKDEEQVQAVELEKALSELLELAELRSFFELQSTLSSVERFEPKGAERALVEQMYRPIGVEDKESRELTSDEETSYDMKRYQRQAIQVMLDKMLKECDRPFWNVFEDVRRRFALTIPSTSLKDLQGLTADSRIQFPIGLRAHIKALSGELSVLNLFDVLMGVYQENKEHQDLAIEQMLYDLYARAAAKRFLQGKDCELWGRARSRDVTIYELSVLGALLGNCLAIMMKDPLSKNSPPGLPYILEFLRTLRQLSQHGVFFAEPLEAEMALRQAVFNREVSQIQQASSIKSQKKTADTRMPGEISAARESFFLWAVAGQVWLRAAHSINLDDAMAASVRCKDFFTQDDLLYEAVKKLADLLKYFPQNQDLTVQSERVRIFNAMLKYLEFSEGFDAALADLLGKNPELLTTELKEKLENRTARFLRFIQDHIFKSGSLEALEPSMNWRGSIQFARTGSHRNVAKFLQRGIKAVLAHLFLQSTLNPQKAKEWWDALFVQSNKMKELLSHTGVGETKKTYVWHYLSTKVGKYFGESETRGTALVLEHRLKERIEFVLSLLDTDIQTELASHLPDPALELLFSPQLDAFFRALLKEVLDSDMETVTQLKKTQIGKRLLGGAGKYITTSVDIDIKEKLIKLVYNRSFMHLEKLVSDKGPEVMKVQRLRECEELALLYACVLEKQEQRFELIQSLYGALAAWEASKAISKSRPSFVNLNDLTFDELKTPHDIIDAAFSRIRPEDVRPHAHASGLRIIAMLTARYGETLKSKIGKIQACISKAGLENRYFYLEKAPGFCSKLDEFYRDLFDRVELLSGEEGFTSCERAIVLALRNLAQQQSSPDGDFIVLLQARVDELCALLSSLLPENDDDFSLDHWKKELGHFAFLWDLVGPRKFQPSGHFLFASIAKVAEQHSERCDYVRLLALLQRFDTLHGWIAPTPAVIKALAAVRFAEAKVVQIAAQQSSVTVSKWVVPSEAIARIVSASEYPAAVEALGKILQREDEGKTDGLQKRALSPVLTPEELTARLGNLTRQNIEAIAALIQENRERAPEVMRDAQRAFSDWELDTVAGVQAGDDLAALCIRREAKAEALGILRKELLALGVPEEQLPLQDFEGDEAQLRFADALDAQAGQGGLVRAQEEIRLAFKREIAKFQAIEEDLLLNVNLLSSDLLQKRRREALLEMKASLKEPLCSQKSRGLWVKPDFGIDELYPEMEPSDRVISDRLWKKFEAIAAQFLKTSWPIQAEVQFTKQIAPLDLEREELSAAGRGSSSLPKDRHGRVSGEFFLPPPLPPMQEAVLGQQDNLPLPPPPSIVGVPPPIPPPPPSAPPSWPSSPK